MTAAVPVSLPVTEALASFDDLPDGVLVVDAAGRVLQVNLAFLALIDRSRGEVVGCAMEALVAEEDMLHLAGYDALFHAGPVQDCIVIFTASDGRQRPLVVSAALARDRQSLLLTARMAGVVQKELADASRWVVQEQERSINLTEARDALFANNEALRAAQADLEQAYAKLQNEVATRERLEQELSLARRLEAIGQLSAGVAHEINTPLQYVGDSVHFLGQALQRITGYLKRVDQLTQAEPAPAWSDVLSGLQKGRKEARLDFLLDEIPRAVQSSKQGVEHVSKIVQALKAFSHRGTEEKGANDLNADGARAITDIVTRLERMTRDAQGRGVAVILTTLTPQRPGSTKGTSPEAVRDLNVRIRDLCRRYNTGCADLYAAFGNEQSPLIGSDGLHPTLAGYDVIAETYFEVIRRMFERTATPAT